MAINTVNQMVYVANQLDKTVSVIDYATGAPITTVKVGGSATAIAVSPDGSRAYVTLKGFAGKVAVIDTGSNTVLTTIKVGANPAGIAFNADGSRVYVTNGSAGTVSVIDTTMNNQVVATIRVGTQPAGVIVAGTRAYVANTNSDSVSVIDTATNKLVATVKVGDAPRGLALDPEGSKVVVTAYGDNTVWSIDTATQTAASMGGVGPHPTSVAYAPDGTMYVANSNDTVTMFDTETGTMLTIATNTNPLVNNGDHSLAVGPDGRVWVTDMNDGVVSVVTPAPPVPSPQPVIGSIAVGKNPQGVAVNPVLQRVYVANQYDKTVSVLDMVSGAPVTTPVKVGGSATAIAVTPNGDYAYVTLKDLSKVAVIDTHSNTVITTIKVGSGPSGIAFNSDGTRAYVTNGSTTTVSVIDTSSQKVVATVRVGSRPAAVVVSPEDGGWPVRVYVANTNSDSVSVIDPATNKVVATVKVGDAPHGLAISPDGGIICVTSYTGNSVYRIYAGTNTVIDSLGVGPNPTSVAYGSDWKMYVANSNDTVTIFDPATGDARMIAIDPAAENGDHYLTVGPDGRVWVTDAKDGFLRLVSFAVEQGPTLIGQSIPLNGEPRGGVVLVNHGTRAVQTTQGINDPVTGTTSTVVTVIDPTNGAVVGNPTILQGAPRGGLVVSIDGSRAAQVTEFYDGGERVQVMTVIDTASGTVVGDPIPITGYTLTDMVLNSDGTRAVQTSDFYDQDHSTFSTVVTVIDTANGTRVGDPIVLDRSTPVGGPVLTSAGTLAYQTLKDWDTGLGAVRIIETTNGAVVGGFALPWGDPQGDLVLNENGTRAALSIEQSGTSNTTSVTVIDTANGTVVGTIALDGNYHGSDLVLSADGTRVARTTEFTDETTGAPSTVVTVIDMNSGMVVGTPVTLDGHPRGAFLGESHYRDLVLNADGTRAYQTTEFDETGVGYSSAVTILDTTNGTVVGSPIVFNGQTIGELVLNDDGTRAAQIFYDRSAVYAVAFIDTGTGTFIGGPVFLNGLPSGSPVFGPYGTRAYVTTSINDPVTGAKSTAVAAIDVDDANSYMVGDPLILPGEPPAEHIGGVVLSPDGTRAYQTIWDRDATTHSVAIIDTGITPAAIGP